MPCDSSALRRARFVAFQASLVGVEFGGKLRGFVEAGVGEQGIVLAGLKYKF